MTAHLYTLTEPLDLEDAREAYRQLGAQRQEARANFEKAIEKAAAAEREYRIGLSRAFVTVEGTAAQREAAARARVAHLSYERDLAAGLVKVAHERLEEIDTVRQSLNRLVDWSRAIDPLAGEDRSANGRPVGRAA